MRAMILAAGYGTRLRPLTDRTPKPLVPVAGRPVIEYTLRLLSAAGIRDVVINVHHLREQIQTCLGDGAAYGVRIAYSVEEAILDSGGGIKQAESLLGSEPFLVVNGDTIMDAPVAALVERHRASGAIATMLLRDDPNAASYGLIRIDERGRVRSILGAPPMPTHAAWAPFMFAGMQVLEPAIFGLMPVAGRPFSITRLTYPHLLADDRLVLGLPFDGPWLTIDTPEALAAAHRALATGAITLSYI